MSDLVAIVRATRKSAKAIERMQRYGFQLRTIIASRAELQRAYDRARHDYESAQRVLAANPLPGDNA